MTAIPYMNRLTNSYLFASGYSGNEYLKPLVSMYILLAFAVILFITGYLSINYDPAFHIATMSRALYVDEGFYSDAAQNFTKFGSWGLVFDSRHWPGAPFLAFIQAIFFSIFGVSLTVARIISILFGILSLLSIYAIARAKLSTVISLLLAIAAVLTFNFTAHTRAAIADPIATGFSLLAIAAYVRMSNRYWAIPISLLLAYMAICSKMYYLFALVTLIIVWIMEVIILPIMDRQKVNKHHLILILASLILIVLTYAALRIRFDDAFEQFLQINSNKTPSLNPLVLIRQFLFSIQYLPFNSKTHLGLLFIGVFLTYCVFTSFSFRRLSQLRQNLNEWGRAGWALSVYLLLGLSTTAALNLPDKAHYHYFTILPIICLSVFAIDAVAPERFKTRVILIFLVSHLLFQTQYYYQWLSRPDRSLVHHANVELVDIIEKNNKSDQIPVIGQYSAQLALYSERMVSLEVRWIPVAGLCQRLEYWRPDFFINIVYPRRPVSEGDRLAKCEILDHFVELARFNVNELWNDELILYQIVYAE